MGLETQVTLMTVPQEFTRLCNAVLSAEHGDDFLPIDDDRPDRGNDGYLKSEKRVFAAHCFKRAQNHGLDQAIQTKMLGDLGKAIVLKREDIWDVDGWTFICNYPIPDHIAERVVKVGAAEQIDVAWRGAAYLAAGIRRHELQEAFPSLHVTQIDAQLARINDALQSVLPESGPEWPPEAPSTVPATSAETEALLHHRPPGWEYLLYAGTLLQGTEALAAKWHDEELEMPRGDRVTIQEQNALQFLQDETGRLRALVGGAMRLFDAEAQERAFGAPGQPGDAARIENLASHVVRTYEGVLDWAAQLRAVVPPTKYERAFELTARMAGTPIRQFRGFVDDAVREINRLPSYLAGDQSEPLRIRVDLVLSLDDELVAEFGREMDRLAA